MSGGTVHERRLDASDLTALARLIGRDGSRIAAATLEVTVPSGLMTSASLAFPLSGDQREFVSITSDWIQVPCDDFHLLRAAVTSTPPSIPVTPIRAGAAQSVGPCSWIELTDFGRIRAVEVVSYADGGDVTSGAVIARETVRYDRALRLRGEGGNVLTLSTLHGSILGEIEIRRSDAVGHVGTGALVETRLTLD